MSKVELPFDKAGIVGSLLLGGLATAFLWGVACTQFLTYFQRYPEDKKFLKISIMALLGMDTFGFIMVVHAIYWYLVINFSNPNAMVEPVWSLLIHVAITSLSNFLLRCLFVRKLWSFSDNNRILCGMIMMLSITSLFTGFAIMALAFRYKTFTRSLKLSTLVYLDFAVGTTGDTTLAVALCYYLYQSRPSFGSMRSVVDAIIFYTVNTGLVTAIDATAAVIAFATMPNNFVFLAFYFLLSKIYLNAYLASLNARFSLRERGRPKDNTLNLDLPISPRQCSLDDGSKDPPSFTPCLNNDAELGLSSSPGR